MVSKKQHINIRPDIPLYATRNSLFGLVLIGLALYIGMCGYHFLEHLAWMDSFLNAAMILSGMGPVTDMKTEAGKLFAGCYALFSGLTFVAIVAMILSPVIHRFFHRIHLESGNNNED